MSASELHIPSALKPGDTIGVMAPSSYVERADIERGIKVLEARGYKVFVHPQTFEREHQSAGNHLQKSLAFQGLWQRADISAIWAAGGGNRSMHLLQTINFAKLSGKPKWLVGFSDVTTLLNAVYAHAGIPTIHGPVFKNLGDYGELDALLSLLGGGALDFPLKEATALNEGTAEGPLVGGNLSLFQYLPGTLPGAFWDGAILFLEDWNEELSKLDRMFLHLKHTRVLAGISGLILGDFGKFPETGRPFGYSFEDIVAEHTDGLDIPIIANAPLGHAKPFYPLPIGLKAALKITATAASLKLNN